MRILLLPIAAILLSTNALAQTTSPAPATLTPVPASAVKLTDTFWAPRLETLRTVTLPLLLEKLEPHLANFDRAAATLKGTPSQQLPATAWEDAEVYKTLEIASLSLLTHPDPDLDRNLDPLIARIAAAQEPDGYLYTPRTINPQQPLPAAGLGRWQNENLDSYELHNLACLINAALAHHRATSKTSLLVVAKKAADLLDNTFGPSPKKSIWPGHPGIESALIRLGIATGTPRYVELGKFFLDQRGPDASTATAPATSRGRGRGGPARGPGSTYSIAQSKFLDQTQVSGHAPTALHLYRAAADLAALHIHPEYGPAVDKLYNDLTPTRLYITGAPAADHAGVFPRPFALSSLNAYANTDAAATFVALNHRLFLATGEAKYIDALERTLYNALLASLSLDGKTFFESQPLEFIPSPTGRNARAIRRDTFSTAYTPLSAARTLAELPGMIYAQSGDTIYVNLYVQSRAEVKLPNGRTLTIEQTTDAPWGEQINLQIRSDAPTEFTLRLRQPDWAAPDQLPSLKFVNLDLDLPPHSVPVSPQDATLLRRLIMKDQYATFGVAGNSNVIVSYRPTVRRLDAKEQSADLRGRIALQRGPFIYCVEGHGNPNRVRNFFLPANTSIAASHAPGLLGGITTLTGKAFALSLDDNDQPSRTETAFTAIPYYAWANRGPAEMTVWLPTDPAAAVPTSAPTLIATARLSASPRADGPTNPNACRDGLEPRASADNSPLSHFDWWPSTNGKLEWVAAEWDTPQTLSSTSIYWWDDTGTGECRPPASWKALYKDPEGNWLPVPTKDHFSTEKDKYNRIAFSPPIKTTALKLECFMPLSTGTQRLSVGIQEWKIR